MEWGPLDEYACAYDLTVPLLCSWKTLIEAFSETYRVQGIHREMLPSCDDVNSVNRLYGRHGSLHQPYGVPGPRLRDGATNQGIRVVCRDLSAIQGMARFTYPRTL